MIKYKMLFVLCLCAGSQAFSQKDISWDIKAGNEAAITIEKSVGLVRLPAAEASVKAVGDRLVGELTSNPYQFSFQIVDQEEPNAFALPGGHVYISRGLIVLINDEDELAGILGHEISHVIERHSAKQQRKSILPAILAAPGILLGSTLGGNIGDKVAAPLLGAGKIFLASYSRKQETEADALGITLAAKAGYRPSALADILHRLELSLKKESGEAVRSNLFNDHPMTPDRMEAIGTQSKTMQVASLPHLFAPETFLRAFDNLLFGPNPGKGIFNRNVFLHPSLKIFWELPKGWNYANESTAAGAALRDEQIVVTIAGKDTQLDTLVESFVYGHYAKTRKKPISDTKIEMPGRKGSEVIVPATQNERIIYTLWFVKDKMTYVIIASGNNSNTEVFRQSGQTFRDLQPADHPLVTFQELSVEKALGNETCVALGQRLANTVTPQFTAIMNGVAEEARFKDNAAVKVIRRRPYYR